MRAQGSDGNVCGLVKKKPYWLKANAVQKNPGAIQTNKNRSGTLTTLCSACLATYGLFFSMPCALEALTVIKTFVVGQLFSGCKRTGEMQKVGCFQTTKNKPQNKQTPTQQKNKVRDIRIPFQRFFRERWISSFW